MTKPSFQPVGGSHAIELMAIGIEWTSPLNETQLAELQKVYDGDPEIKDFLPQHIPIQSFAIQPLALAFNASQSKPDMLQPPQFVAQAGGFDIRRIQPDGKVSWLTSVRPQLLACHCSDYDRWKNVKPTALSLLQPFVDMALATGAEISAIGLQYHDAFRLPEGISPQIAKELFRQDCQWLPDHMFREPSYWHCHQGWFSRGPDERRVLNNVTTDISDVNGLCFARIGGQHRVFATSFDAKTPQKIDARDMDVILECLHNENKNVINGMLSDAALESIGCSVGGGA
ncbi:TIGR04255 family protein [Burkholderia vietnamiensis]|uniref:TIGR04255 family protein n=1 Tax=Burkholderia vietnamiensis TaxID=60552 RepID=A0ABS1AUQ0_BURVI|nr:TIGR04255 family protein [Burkholderia vietnamiensis]MBJ9687822.1 TIGR04255 family protein [Burkholderia vietnamiensis]